MRCFECQVTMKEVPLSGVQVDRCPHCQGVWFDHGELERARMHAGRREHTWVPADATREPLEASCPSCEGTSFEVVKVEGQRVQRCRGCRGLHVRGPSLEALLERWGASSRSSTGGEAGEVGFFGLLDMLWILSELG